MFTQPSQKILKDIVSTIITSATSQQMSRKDIDEYFSSKFSEEILRLIFQHFSSNDLVCLSRVNQLFDLLVNRYIIGWAGDFRFLPCFSCKNYVRLRLPLENKKINFFLSHRLISVDKEVSIYSYIVERNNFQINIDDIRGVINAAMDKSNSIEGYPKNVIIRSCDKKRYSSCWVNVGLDNCLCRCYRRDKYI